MKKLFLKPGHLPDGTLFTVLNPARGRAVPDCGEELAVNAYVERRIKEGALVQVKKPIKTKSEEK